jgi:hypothetical protein
MSESILFRGVTLKHFDVRQSKEGAAALAEQYIRRVGLHEGQLKVTYEPQAKQEALPGMEQTKPEAPADAQIPVEETLRGEALEQHKSRTGTLPSAAEMQSKVRELAARGGKAKV